MNLNNFTIKAQEAVQQAVQLVTKNNQQVIEPVHLLKAVIMTGESVTNFIFQKLGVNAQNLNMVLDRQIESYPKVSGGEPYLSSESNTVLQKAIDYSSKMGDQYVSLEPIILALFTEKSTASQILKDAGVTEKELRQAIEELRKGCPWDKKQTMESLRPLSIEEIYELGDAVLEQDMAEVKKELGDLLMHMVFYAQIGEEKGEFDIADVLEAICEKLKYRHPHIYGEVKVKDAQEVLQNWEQLKLKEKDGNKSVLSGVPAALPSLIKAYRIQDKARNVGFDWEEREQVWDKVKEEIGEFQEEVANMDKDKAEAEFGDVMFSLINAARLYKINPDNALERTNQKFIRRFNYLEEHTIKEGKNLKDMSLEEMDAIWNEAKKKGL